MAAGFLEGAAEGSRLLTLAIVGTACAALLAICLVVAALIVSYAW